MFLTRNYTYSTSLRTYTQGRADSTQADRIGEGLGIATSL